MPKKGDEFHHFGWNACSSAFSPLTGNAFLERLEGLRLLDRSMLLPFGLISIGSGWPRIGL
jgi:56kDa selenium binding protein (SBP56)